MATDNPRAVDDLTLSKSKKDPLNRVVFYFSAVLILIFSLVTFLFNDFANHECRASVGNFNLWLVLSAGSNTIYGLRDFYCLLKIWQYQIRT